MTPSAPDPVLRAAARVPAPDDRHAAWVEQVCRQLERSDDIPTLARLAEPLGVSPFHLHRIFKAATGITPHQYARAVRAGRLREALADGAPVTDAIYRAGYASSGRFYEESAELLGMTPRAYRAGGAAETIRVAAAPCALGMVLVAATARGLCAILLGDDAEPLLADVRRRFPRASIEDGDETFRDWVRQVTAFVEEPRRGLSLPLDIRGTAFQQRVWALLRTIPPGQTLSYGEVARRLGAPRATRAVAQACGANPLAVAVPCHRVVAGDGRLTGYRWGLERKRALLKRETGD